jgi:glyoxylase-like metal-dependent hydrolase (beta-lactamase superfamily II)
MIMELVKIKENVYYIPNSTNIGVIADDGMAIMIDTGIDKDTIKKAVKFIIDNGLKPFAVINTHSHADHCGGNKWLQENYDVKVYAFGFEASIISDTELEPLYLFSGAKPISELENKFLKAEPTKDIILLNEGKQTIGQTEIEIVPLYGHSPKQIGVLFDNVLFCADSYFPKETIEKHKVLYFTDIEQSKKTLEWLKNSNFSFYLPSHGKLDTDIKGLVDLNLRHIQAVCDFILDNLDPKIRDARKFVTAVDVIADVCEHFSIEIKSPQQNYLMNTVVLAYLSYLKENGKCSFDIHDNALFWEK